MGGRAPGGGRGSGKRIRIVSDLHVGSPVGLLGGRRSKKHARRRNELQERLWEYWKDLWKTPYDILVLNGDLMDLKYWDDVDELQVALIDVLEEVPGIREKELYIVEGTKNHERFFQGVVSEFKPVGGRTFEFLSLSVEGKTLNIAHHPELGGGTIYPGTVLSKTALFARVAYGRGKVVKVPDVIVRSHYHYFAAYQDSSITVVQTPAFCYQDDYAVKKGLFRFIPDIGAVDLVVSEDRVLVEPRLYE
ncbi:MAG: hypothetical protein NZ902_06485 [Acidilobaceae archaeon]|nr:hypothetical protein [Acidilobaceae archaeon]